MPIVDGARMRQVILELVESISLEGRRHNSALQPGVVVGRAAAQLGISQDIEKEQALLTYFGDLFRLGYLAWGHNLGNPTPPFCHVTAAGRVALQHLSRDPANPDGYLAYLSRRTSCSPLVLSYIQEAVSTYNAQCPKAAILMVGVASECAIFELRDAVATNPAAIQRIRTEWRAHRVLEGLTGYFNACKNTMPDSLKERFESYWGSLAQYIRISRNDAGHPAALHEYAAETSQAALLMFPELVTLTGDLAKWSKQDNAKNADA